MLHIVAIISFIVVSYFPNAMGMKFSTSLTFNGVSSNYLGSESGLSNQGTIKVDYTVGPTNAGSQSSSLLLVILSSGQRNSYYNNLGSNPAACNSPSLFRQVIYGTGTVTYSTITGPDIFSVLVLQCTNGNPRNPTQSSFTVSMFDPDPRGTSYPVHYLSIDTVTYVTFVEGLLIGYCILLFFLGLQFFYCWRFVKVLHLLFLVALVLMILSVVARYIEYLHSDKYGDDPDSLVLFSQITYHFSTFFNLVVLLLLSLGWTILRIFLTVREKQISFICLLIYFILGLASASCVGNSVSFFIFDC